MMARGQGRRYHAIDATALLLADSSTAHQIGQSFIARLITVDEALDRYERFSRARDLNTIAVDLDHHGYPAYQKVLMDKRVCNQLSNHDVRNEFHFPPQRALDGLILWKLSHSRAYQFLKTNGVSACERLIEPRFQLRDARINDEAGRLASHIRKILQS